MDDIIKRFCPRYDFDSYEDMKQNFKINVPDDFNFGFDVVDAWADIEPEKLALVWTNDAGDMARYTFKDIKDNSNRAVNFLLEKGIKKGDIVMLVLKQRPEVWFIITALHKIGAIVIPASFQLMKKDYVYRINAAGVKMLITVGDDDVVQHVRDSLPECPNLEYYVTVGDKPVDGAINYRVFTCVPGQKIRQFGSDTKGTSMTVKGLNGGQKTGIIVLAQFANKKWSAYTEDDIVYVTPLDAVKPYLCVNPKADGKVYLIWSSVPTSVRYKVMAREKGTDSWELIGATRQRCRVTVQLDPNKEYEFLVRGLNAKNKYTPMDADDIVSG